MAHSSSSSTQTSGDDGAVVGRDPRWHASAYAVHSSLEDWAQFVELHLAIGRAKPRNDSDSSSSSDTVSVDDQRRADRLLGLLGLSSATTMAITQQPRSPASAGETFTGAEPPQGYAMGWKTQWDEANDEDGDTELHGRTSLLLYLFSRHPVFVRSLARSLSGFAPSSERNTCLLVGGSYPYGCVYR